MASCVSYIGTKNYQNLIIGFQVTVENVGDVFWDTVYIRLSHLSLMQLITKLTSMLLTAHS